MAWRDMGDKERTDFIQWITESANRRWIVGDNKYHSSALGFQGDPLNHLIEELQDALLYAYYLRRQRQDA